jgi:hypothetical protein
MKLKAKLKEIRAFKKEVLELGESIEVSLYDPSTTKTQIQHIEKVKIRLSEISATIIADREQIRHYIPWNQVLTTKTQGLSDIAVDSFVSGLFGGVSTAEAREIVNQYNSLPLVIVNYINKGDKKIKTATEYLQDPKGFKHRMLWVSIIQLMAIFAFILGIALWLKNVSKNNENNQVSMSRTEQTTMSIVKNYKQ